MSGRCRRFCFRRLGTLAGGSSFELGGATGSRAPLSRLAQSSNALAPRIDPDVRANDPRFTCPACGYDALPEPAWVEPEAAGGGSDEICPKCKIQFGYDDAAGGDPVRRKAIWRTWVGSEAQKEVLRRMATSRQKG